METISDENEKIYENSAELYNVLKDMENITMNSQKATFHNDLLIIDVYLTEKRNQDKKFLKDSFLRENLRRGLTFIKKKDTNAVLIVRRGLRKFFEVTEIMSEAFKQNLSQKKLKEESSTLIALKYKAGFSKANKYLNEDSKNEKGLKLWRMTKEDGTNAQVSYFRYSQLEISRKRHKSTGFWLCCSKNGCLAFEKESQIQDNPEKKSRLSYACKIAKHWLRIIKEKNQDQLEELKIFLTQNTLVGEYINSEQFVIHEKGDLIFYSVVPKEGKLNCLGVEQSNQIFEEFGLNHVKSYLVGILRTRSSFSELLRKEIESGIGRSLFEEGEGFVFYIENNKEEVLGLLKLKTTEYLVFLEFKSILRKFIEESIDKEDLESKVEAMLSRIQRMKYEETEYYKKLLNKISISFKLCGVNKKNFNNLFLVLCGAIKKIIDAGRKIDHQALGELRKLRKN